MGGGDTKYLWNIISIVPFRTPSRVEGGSVRYGEGVTSRRKFKTHEWLTLTYHNGGNIAVKQGGEGWTAEFKLKM